MVVLLASRSSKEGMVKLAALLLSKLVVVGIISSSILHTSLTSYSPSSTYLPWAWWQRQRQRLSFSPIVIIGLFEASNEGTRNNSSVKVRTRNTTQLTHLGSMRSYPKKQRPSPSPTDKLVPRQLQSTRIVGGTDTSEERYPYFVSVLNSRAQHVCGGSLVAPDLVLTAAHCVSSSTVKWVQIGRWKRRRDGLSSGDSGAGTSSSGHSSSASATSGQEQSYSDVDDDYEEFDLQPADSETNKGNDNINGIFIIHPSYEEETNFQNDISLIHLPRQSTHPWVTINMDPDRPYNDQYPVEQERQQHLQPLTALGLGYTVQGDSDSIPYVLQEATLSYVSNLECEQSKEHSMMSSSMTSSLPTSSLSYNGLITPDMMCASDGTIQQQDACQGDSGKSVRYLHCPIAIALYCCGRVQCCIVSSLLEQRFGRWNGRFLMCFLSACIMLLSVYGMRRRTSATGVFRIRSTIVFIRSDRSSRRRSPDRCY